MLSPHIKRKVDKLWDRFWSAGLTNPLVAVEQITYLLFLKRLEAIDKVRVSKGLRSIYSKAGGKRRKGVVANPRDEDVDPRQCRWSYIRQHKTDAQHLIKVVFPWLRTLDARLTDSQREDEEGVLVGSPLGDAYFQVDPAKGAILSEAIDLIDELFAHVGEGSSAAQDVMSDTFEYLLSEIATAGKNGQFRTPRHIIRFMVELLDPEPGMRIIDPAAGTAGFLFSAQQYLLRKLTPEEKLRIEWNGAPHRASGERATPAQDKAIHDGSYFVGLDNDRTMARIGWMNLFLHGMDTPRIIQGDSLSRLQDKGKSHLARWLEPESYDLVLANPPFAGTIDTADLEPDGRRFPRAAPKGKKANEALTNKSELLFVWLALDLLRIGGRCAVVVPEGVLFNSSEAHVRLRRELLTDHVVEAVISLPGGVFLPYIGVKTSVVVFRKKTSRDDKSDGPRNEPPHTQEVWFYEVENDGYTLDTRRTAQPGRDNDLWDALDQFRRWLEGTGAKTNTYYQPRYHAERWRVVQDLLLERFPDQPTVREWRDQVAAIHEVFTELARGGQDTDPASIEARWRNSLDQRFENLLLYALRNAITPVWQEATSVRDPDLREELAREHLNRAIPRVRKLMNEQRMLFEQEESRGWALFRADFASIQERVVNSIIFECRNNRPSFLVLSPQDEDLAEGARAIALEYAKLEGFDVMLRTLNREARKEVRAAPRHWVVKVREYARRDDWTSGRLKGSHDKAGNVRPEYVAATPVYDEEGQLREGVLTHDCIEARDWNLSAGQYKPFDLTQLSRTRNVADLIRELKETEQKVLGGLDTLLEMVEGRR
jgi:type I restriction enzyme M protein